MQARLRPELQQLPENFLVLDPSDPSPLFTAERLRYIFSVSEFLSPSELQQVQDVEWYILNKFTNGVAGGEIPGLRGPVKVGAVDVDHIFVKRFTDDPYPKMIDLFLDYEPLDFPKTSGCSMPGFRVTSPHGDRYYPYKVHGDIAAWYQRFEQSAKQHRTVLGKFDQGKFVVSDGQRFDFAELKVEGLSTKSYPNGW